MQIAQKTTGELASSTSSTAMPPPQRKILMGSAAATGFKANLQENEPLMAFPPLAHAESQSSPVTGHVEAMHLPRAPHKAMPAPPESYERSMGRAQRRPLTTRKLNL